MGIPDEREIVLDILVEHDTKKTYSNVLIRNAQDRYSELPLAQRSFIKRLAEGTIERQLEMDGCIRRHLNNPGAKMKPVVRNLLRMSIYQIYYMDSVPDHAAVDEAIRILKRRKLHEVTGFVNGVLRAVCRDKAAAERGTAIVMTGKDGETTTVYAKKKATTDDADKILKKAARETRGLSKTAAEKTVTKTLSQSYSMPAEIVEMWEDDYGKEETAKLLQSLLEIRPVTIRMDTRVPVEKREETLQAMRDMGVVVEPAKWISYAYTVKKTPGITNLPGFAEGLFAVQDESSMMVAYAAGLGRKERTQGPVILDLCAAPGGKSMHAASMAPDAQIHSYDLSLQKTEQIRTNAARMNYDNITVAEHDATVYDETLENTGDIVICDLPCSGLGVITKKRDIKYNVNRASIRSLVSLQKEILRNAVRYVKKGGVLVYSTCTIDRQENEKMADFLAKELGLTPDPLAALLPEGLPGIDRKHPNRIQFLPHVHGTDGFFVARFIKE